MQIVVFSDTIEVTRMRAEQFLKLNNELGNKIIDISSSTLLKEGEKILTIVVVYQI